GQRHANDGSAGGIHINVVDQTELVDIDRNLGIVTGLEGGNDLFFDILDLGRVGYSLFDVVWWRRRVHDSYFSLVPFKRLARPRIRLTIDDNPFRRPSVRFLSKPIRVKNPSTSNPSTSSAFCPL